jgi:hypothetical protein
VGWSILVNWIRNYARGAFIADNSREAAVISTRLPPLIGRPRDSAEYLTLQKMNPSWKTNHNKLQTAYELRRKGTSCSHWNLFSISGFFLFPSQRGIDLPWVAKRQCRVSHAPEDEPKLENQPQQASNGTTIEPKVVLTGTYSVLVGFFYFLPRGGLTYLGFNSCAV